MTVVVKHVAWFFAAAWKTPINGMMRVGNRISVFCAIVKRKFIACMKFIEWFFTMALPIGLVVVCAMYWIGKKTLSDFTKETGYNKSEIDLLIDHKISSTAEKIAKRLSEEIQVEQSAKQIAEKFYAEQESKRLAEELQTEKMVNRLRGVLVERESEVSSKQVNKKSSNRVHSEPTNVSDNDDVDIDELVREEVLRQLKGEKID